MNSVGVVETCSPRGALGVQGACLHPVSCTLGLGDPGAAPPRPPVILANLPSTLPSFLPAGRWVFTPTIRHFSELFPSPQSVMEPFHGRSCEHVGTLAQFR